MRLFNLNSQKFRDRSDSLRHHNLHRLFIAPVVTKLDPATDLRHFGLKLHPWSDRAVRYATATAID